MRKENNICLEQLLKYFLIFIDTILLLLLLLVLTSKIPRSAIRDNLKESADLLESKEGIEDFIKRRDYSYIHYYADSIILNIINGIDSNKPIESVMQSSYYEEIYADVNKDFIKSVNENKEPNQQYIRYWHGSMIILRPLLIKLNLEQIYLINKIVLWILAIALFILLFVKDKKTSIIYLISMIMIAFPIVPMCLEYSWTFYIMLITSIISILIEKKGDKPLFTLFLVTGILTCFFDFLSTEIITIFVPILLVIGIRKKDDRISSFKDSFIFILKASILWGIAYIGMWFTKWILASIVLKTNALDYVTEKAFIRINGLQGIESIKEMYLGGLYKNFHTLFPLNAIKKTSYVWRDVGIFLTIVIVSIDWKNIKKKWFSFLMFIIGIMPYIRYLILANHSYRHSFFTFREQIITIIALCFIIVDCFNKDLWLKKLK